MDKTIIIDGKPVVFRKTASTDLQYQREFGRELMQDIGKLLPFIDVFSGDDQKAKTQAALSMPTEWMYNIAYIMAKQADSTIRDQYDWLDRFDDINIYDVIMELLPMIRAERMPSPKNA